MANPNDPSPPLDQVLDLAALASREEEIAAQEAALNADEARLRTAEMGLGRRRQSLQLLAEWLDERERALVERAHGFGEGADDLVTGLGAGGALSDTETRSFFARSKTMDLRRQHHLLERERLMQARRELTSARQAELDGLDQALARVETRLTARDKLVGEAFRRLLAHATNSLGPAQAPSSPAAAPAVEKPSRRPLAETIIDSPAAKAGNIIRESPAEEQNPTDAQAGPYPERRRRSQTQPMPAAVVATAVREAELAARRSEGREGDEDPADRFDLNKILFSNPSRRSNSSARHAHSKPFLPELRLDGLVMSPSALALSPGEDDGFIATDRPRPEGTEVNLEIRIPDGPIHRTRGVVVWTREAATADGPVGMRVRFVNLNETARAALLELTQSRSS